MELKVNRVIDALIPDSYDVDDFHCTVLRGSFIGESGPYRTAYDKLRAAEQRVNLVADVLGVSRYDIDRLVHIARKWYERTNWQISLPDRDADRLLDFLIKQKY